VTSFFLAVFSVGIGTGSMLCAKRLNGEITARTVPFAALAISILLFVFANVIAALPAPQNHSQDILGVLGSPHGITVSVPFGAFSRRRFLRRAALCDSAT
jgi:acyl-[acyl-carrier-protein]-phospholipid O-acyltransferase / long-chain-fatty-acid--[acyl-carrier-protein] ligase